MTDVTKEMVEAGWAAMREKMQGVCLQELAIGECDNPVSCQCRREVRAALEAALPLVVAGEREAPEKAPDTRACTCHPSDNPPVPCARRYAYSDCVAAANDAPADPEPGDD